MGQINCEMMRKVVWGMVGHFLFWLLMMAIVFWFVMMIAGIASLVGAIALAVILLRWLSRKIYFWAMVLYIFIMSEVLDEDDEARTI